jgi:hypothetical protein
MDLRVGKNWQLIKKIGSGAFGEIYEGKKNLFAEFPFRKTHPDQRVGRYQACKFGLLIDALCWVKEPIKTQFPQLEYENKLYRFLKGGGKC